MSESVAWHADGARARGVLTLTASARPAPAVIVAPAIAGLNDYVLRRCRQLASTGYVTLALDYFDGEGPPPLGARDEILAAVAGLDDRRHVAAILGAVGFLEERREVLAGSIGVLGFCIGGSLALLAAAEGGDRLAGTVAFYGQLQYATTSQYKPVSPLDAAEGITGPVLGHFGENDWLVPIDHVAELRKATADRPAEIYTYPGAGHAFDEDFRPEVFRPVASTIAWTRTMAFLDWHLA